MRLFYQIAFFVLCGLVSSYSFGQVNLVPNYSFEIYDTCPNTTDQIKHAAGWTKYNYSSPDYYNACDNDTVSVPDNLISYQPDHRNCTAYAGIGTWCYVPNTREFIGIQLNTPLTIGQKYFISFYAVMGWEKLDNGSYYGIPSNNIGIRLSTVAYSDTNECPIDNFAHINYPFVLTDSVNWTRISGSIVADSAFEYLVVGNFFDDANTDTIGNNCPNCLNFGSYYLIDDVCVSTDSLLCNGGIDAIPCIASTENTNPNEFVKIFPNPAEDFLNISFDNKQNVQVHIQDIFGQIVYSNNIIKESELLIDLRLVPIGIYFLRLNFDGSNRTIFKKIIRQ